MDRDVKEQLFETINKNPKLPKHVAIIMDGNGRWAKKQGNIRTFGHQSGVSSVREVIDGSLNLGISYLTLYTFSTENWNRPKSEVNALMSLLVKTIEDEKKILMEKNVKVRAIGKREDLYKEARESIEEIEELTKNNSGLNLNIALSYSGRSEIINGINRLISDGVREVDEDILSSYLYTKDMPDPDLVIRTGGEFRVSNFLLWQIAYSEFYVTDILWPEFNEQNFYEAISFYLNRERRFGKTSEQLK
ncbi:MAG: isoprenyl transferase [Candidatus Cloacimonadota bacterium]|nr:MAG: isoprenyl transferase [Candidatus Cloacimonadota bacterium]